MSAMSSTTARAAIAAAALAVQLWGLYAPEMPGGDAVGSVPGLDKVAHAAMFALVSWASVRLIVPPGGPFPISRRQRNITLALVGAIALHAPLSEWIQGRMPTERMADPRDALADLAGIALGLAVAAGERRLRTRRAP